MSTTDWKVVAIRDRNVDLEPRAYGADVVVTATTEDDAQAILDLLLKRGLNARMWERTHT